MHVTISSASAEGVAGATDEQENSILALSEDSKFEADIGQTTDPITSSCLSSINVVTTFDEGRAQGQESIDFLVKENIRGESLEPVVSSLT